MRGWVIQKTSGENRAATVRTAWRWRSRSATAARPTRRRSGTWMRGRRITALSLRTRAERRHDRG